MHTFLLLPSFYVRIHQVYIVVVFSRRRISSVCRILHGIRVTLEVASRSFAKCSTGVEHWHFYREKNPARTKVSLRHTRELDILELARLSLTSPNKLKNNGRTHQGTSEGSETSADEHSTRRIQLCVDSFCRDPVFAGFET